MRARAYRVLCGGLAGLRIGGRLAGAAIGRLSLPAIAPAGIP
jgi:hypothetical protein